MAYGVWIIERRRDDNTVIHERWLHDLFPDQPIFDTADAAEEYVSSRDMLTLVRPDGETSFELQVREYIE